MAGALNNWLGKDRGPNLPLTLEQLVSWALGASRSLTARLPKCRKEVLAQSVFSGTKRTGIAALLSVAFS